jgi:2-dehydro-3-deoxyphosphogluconate aldolase/(4S)-4-hydroxy-2-oxoglutarate aldolase
MSSVNSVNTVKTVITANTVNTVSVLERIGNCGILPVAVVESAADAPALAGAVSRGGLDVIEVTLRTRAAAAAIRAMVDTGAALVGAGTVRTPAQVQAAAEAGAAFVVTPGLSGSVVRECALLGVPVVPGIATPTELMTALDAGLNTVKFFPALAAGGTAMLRSMAGPFADARFVPTGGITPENADAFLSLPQVLAVGGSWMVTADLVSEGRFDEICELSKSAAALVSRVRLSGSAS